MMTEQNSITQAEAERLKRALTNAIFVGYEESAPGAVLKIADRWHVLTQVFFEISDTKAQNTNTVALFWAGAIEGHVFCILKYLPHVTADEEIVPFMVMEVLDQDALQVVSEQCIQNLANKIVAAVEAEGETFAPVAVDFFGPVQAKRN